MTYLSDMKKEKIRTLGFYQPFGSLMLHGKIETRWVKDGKKPPFPLGKYLFYTTQKPCDPQNLESWCGGEMIHWIWKVLEHEPTKDLDGYAIATGNLVEVKLLTLDDENTFVKFVGSKIDTSSKIIYDKKVQWGLHFKDVKRIAPFKWKFGKQGVGFVPDSELRKIKPI